MTVRHSSNPIPPFPPEMDRSRFGDWVSGFADGESHFRLGFAKQPGQHYPQCCVKFCIGLRADDELVLQLIRSFFACGTMCFHPRSNSALGKPAWSFNVQAVPDLARIIVPHFHQYPLFSRKKRDFIIWEQGIALAYRVWQRPWRNNRGGKRHCRMLPRWELTEREEFRSLADALKAVRVYGSSPVALPPPRQPRAEPPSLFDCLP